MAGLPPPCIRQCIHSFIHLVLAHAREGFEFAGLENDHLETKGLEIGGLGFHHCNFVAYVIFQSCKFQSVTRP